MTTNQRRPTASSGVGAPEVMGSPRSRQSDVYAAFTAALTCLAALGCAGDTVGGGGSAGPVRAGIEVLLSDSLDVVRGRRVGLVTNHTGLYYAPPAEGGEPGVLSHTIDALHGSPHAELVALYAPEHGIRGDVRGGDVIDDSTDPDTGLPIFSLYGETRKPSPEMLSGVDVLVFDMQDVGARYYTYPSTMALAMEAAGEAGIPFVVLDRPNPIRGDVVQGNVLDPAFSTFVGMYPVPMRHGLTMGELARLFVGEFGVEVDLHVVPADGWRRDMPFDRTGVPWVPPSPNMPSVESALAYPGTCLFEGTPISVGRGTDRAFEWIGAPWLDARALADAMNARGFRGVRFEPVTFTPRAPTDGKFDGQEIPGVRIVAESSDYDAPRVGVALVVETYRMSGDRWEWRVAHFDRLSGTDALRLGIEAGQDLDALTAGWDAQIEAFRALRAPYLIYP